MKYFVISAKFVPLKYYTLSSQLRRLTSFSVGLFGSANSVTRSYPVMRRSCITCVHTNEWQCMHSIHPRNVEHTQPMPNVCQAGCGRSRGMSPLIHCRPITHMHERTFKAILPIFLKMEIYLNVIVNGIGDINNYWHCW